MLDYASAAQLYSGRKDKHVGRKVMNRVYMKLDQTRDCFVLSELWSKWETVPDPSRPRQTTYRLAPKERWDLRPFAEIHRTHTLITQMVPNTPMNALFSVVSFASKTVKVSGRTWIYKDSTHKHQKIHGDLPIRIKDDKIASLTPPKVRVTDSKKRNEMNRMIQSVRNLLKVRTKLGTFNSLTRAQVAEYMRQSDIANKWQNRWQMMDRPAQFLELLNAVNPEDLKSFYPLLWLADNNWYYQHDNRYGSVDWVERYNNLVNRMREKMRRELGVIEYVETAEREADSSDGSVEADRADELREV